MKGNRIALETRLSNIRAGLVGDIDYSAKIIKRFAKTPILNYMDGFPDECKELLKILGISLSDAEQMTYCEMARKVYELYQSKDTERNAYNAMKLIAKPFDCYYEERSMYNE